MISLKEFIENYQINESWYDDALKMGENTRRSIVAAQYFTLGKPKKFSLGNKEDRRSAWAHFVNWCKKNGNHTPKEFGFADLENLITWVVDNKDKYKDKPKGFYELAEFFESCNKTNKAVLKKTHDDFVATYGAGKEIDVDYTGDDLDSENFKNAIVCRSKWGDNIIMLYIIKGAWKDVVTDFKKTYCYDSGCNYYQVRPCLLEYWLGLDDAHKKATCPDGVESNDDLTELD